MNQKLFGLLLLFGLLIAGFVLAEKFVFNAKTDVGDLSATRDADIPKPQTIIKTYSGLFVSISENEIMVKNLEGKNETYTLTEQTIYKLAPHPRLLQEGNLNLSERLITKEDLKENDKLAIDILAGKTAQTIFVMSENSADFE